MCFNLVSVTLLNLLMQFSDDIFEILFEQYRVNANSDSFTYFSLDLIWTPFISFSCLIVVARTSNTMLNKSGENGLPCLVPDLREVISDFEC